MDQRFSNVSEVPLSLGVFLASDNYDYNDDSTVISTTSLIKPVRQLILGNRAEQTPGNRVAPALASMMPSRLGTAVHDKIEWCWTHNHGPALEAMGVPAHVRQRIRINPTKEQLVQWEREGIDIIPVYLEQRTHKQVGKWTVSGKFDFVGDGYPEDFKTTGVYTYILGNNTQKYKLQLSIYRWLNPEIITQDVGKIQMIFTDWSAMQARQDPRYPQQRFHELRIPLLSYAETDLYVNQRLNLIESCTNLDEHLLPLCDDEDLWRTEPKFKWYKNGDTTAKRSTKNFDSLHDAQRHMTVEGNGVGAIKEVPGEVKACHFCPGFALCSQKDDLIRSGDLNV